MGERHIWHYIMSSKLCTLSMLFLKDKTTFNVDVHVLWFVEVTLRGGEVERHSLFLLSYPGLSFLALTSWPHAIIARQVAFFCSIWAQ